MHRLIAPAAAVLAIALAAPAFSKTDDSVSVSIGPQLQQKAGTYGAREFNDLSRWLGDAVSNALAHSSAKPARVNLVIEDVVPNRPTFAQLGRHFDLSINSVSLGGAKIGGYVESADGVRTPIHYSWYETSLENERGATTWYDADRAFSQLANRIAKGDIPQTYARTSPNSGDFGDRLR